MQRAAIVAETKKVQDGQPVPGAWARVMNCCELRTEYVEFSKREDTMVQEYDHTGGMGLKWKCYIVLGTSPLSRGDDTKTCLLSPGVEGRGCGKYWPGCATNTDEWDHATPRTPSSIVHRRGPREHRMWHGVRRHSPFRLTLPATKQRQG